MSRDLHPHSLFQCYRFCTKVTSSHDEVSTLCSGLHTSLPFPVHLLIGSWWWTWNLLLQVITSTQRDQTNKFFYCGSRLQPGWSFAQCWPRLIPLHLLAVMMASWWSSILFDLGIPAVNNRDYLATLASSLQDVHKRKKWLSTLCDQEHLLCFVKHLQWLGGRGWEGLWAADGEWLVLEH